jgi:ANTAR domain-containing protein/GAF domain-containing protein
LRVEQARSALVWAEVSACARREGVPASSRHVVVACAEALAAAGVCLSLARDSSPYEPVLASAPVAEALEELQFTLGQGPGIDAATGRGLVLADDLAGPGAHRLWPAFAPAAADRGVRGMFAFPVAVGAALIGVLDVYRLQPGPLTAEELAQGLMFADVALVLTLDAWGGITARPDGVADAALSARRAQVHQATGMVAAQLGVAVPDALALLRAHAYANGLGLADLAAEVLARRAHLGVHGKDRPQDFPGPDRPAADRVRDDGNDSLEPGTQPDGRNGGET